MRRTLAFGLIGLSVLLGAAMITWADEGQEGMAPRWSEQRFDGHGAASRFGRERMGRQGGRHGFGHGGGLLALANNPRARTYLNLSDQQVNRLHQIGVDAQKSSVKSRADLQLRGIELRELLRADSLDHDAIMRKVDEISALRGQVARQHMETMLMARNVLTTEQQKKLRSFRQEHAFAGPGREHMMERRGGRAGAPGPPVTPPGHPDEPPVQ